MPDSDLPSVAPRPEKDEEFSLLIRLHVELEHALGSLEGKRAKRHGLYQLYSARFISQAVAGYIALRRSRLLPASVLLIRPTIEALFKLMAIRAQPHLLLRLAYDEYRAEVRIVKAIPDDRQQPLLAHLEEQHARFRAEYGKEYPGRPFVKEPLHMQDLATAANMKRVYEVHYRVYCQHTHAALRVTADQFGDNPKRDDPTMSICCLGAIECLTGMGAGAPNFAALSAEFNAIGRRAEAELQGLS